MDRDQVNTLHYLFQGDPAKQLSDQMLQGRLGGQRLIWCDTDTTSPLENSGIIRRESGALCLPAWCVSFIDEVEKQLRSMPKPDFIFGYPFSAPIRKPGERRPAFVAIPYRSKFKAIKDCILDAGRAANFCCEVTGDLSSPGNIMDQVWCGIRGADVIVADVTGGNRNVMLEVGLAMALGKEVIILGQKKTLPFDIQHCRKISYDPSNLEKLKKALVEGFLAVSARYPHEGKEPRF